MSSNLRCFAQIPSTSRYLEVVRTVINISTAASDMPAFTVAAATDPALVGDIVVEGTTTPSTIVGKGSTITISNANGSLIAGNLYKDLGRQILIVDSARRHIALFRQVQLVDGVGTEGVGGSSPLWGSNTFVKVWAADASSTDIVVARTGPGGSA